MTSTIASNSTTAYTSVSASAACSPLNHLNQQKYPARNVNLKNPQQQHHPDDEHDVPELQVRIVLTSGHSIIHPSASVTDTSPSYQTFAVRSEDLHCREEEMLHVARTYAVPLSRWNGSRLYKYYREQNERHQLYQQQEETSFNGGSTTTSRLQRKMKKPQQQQELPMVLTLDPTKFCRDQHLSKVFVWKPWLGQMMQSYLQTGVLRVHEDATGDDWLICCEYFGILYQPSQVVFETLNAYQNVSAWSEYLSKRCDIAEWVAETVMKKQQTVFVVSQQDEGWSVEVDQQTTPAAILLLEENSNSNNKAAGGGSTSPPPSAAPTPTSVVAPSSLVDFFHDEDHPVSSPTRQVRMRTDFAGYLEYVLSHVQCRFDMELVTLLLLTTTTTTTPLMPKADPLLQVPQQRFAPRAVLRIRLLLHPPPPPLLKKSTLKEELPFPVDELVAEDLQRGTLEMLVQQVDARNAAAAATETTAVGVAEPNNDNNKPTTTSTNSNNNARLTPPSVTAGTRTTTAAATRSNDKPDSSPASPTAPTREGHNPHHHHKDTLALPINELATISPSAASVTPAQQQEQHPLLQVDGLPFNIIRTHSTGEGNQSVTSTLTGPFFVDEDGSITHVHGHGPNNNGRSEYHEGVSVGRGTPIHWWKHPDAASPAAAASAAAAATSTTDAAATAPNKNNHTTTNDKNNDVKNQVKALLDDATPDADTTSGGGGEGQSKNSNDNNKRSNANNVSWGAAPSSSSSSEDDEEDAANSTYDSRIGVDGIGDQWEWLTSICQYSTVLLSPSSQQLQPSSSSIKENLLNRNDSAVAEDAKRKATLLALQNKAALVRSEVRIQKNPSAGNTLTAMRQDGLHEQLRALTIHSEDVDTLNGTGTNRSSTPMKQRPPEDGPSNAATPRTPPPRAPPSPTESSACSDGLVERPEPPPSQKSAGYDCPASSTVSAAANGKPNPTNRKRPGLKGLFRRRKLSAEETN